MKMIFETSYDIAMHKLNGAGRCAAQDECIVQRNLGPSAVAQDRVGPTIAEQVLTEASCRAWMVLHENNWGHQGREKADVEQWTVQYVRKYAKAARERMERDDPTKDWGAEEGADVSDFQIVKWISGYCAKNPDDPIIKAAFFLTFTFGNSADHTQLPPAP